MNTAAIPTHSVERDIEDFDRALESTPKPLTQFTVERNLATNQITGEPFQPVALTGEYIPKTPVSRTPEIIEYILAKLSEGVFMTVICRQPGMPSVSAVHKWSKNDAALAKDIEEARLIGCDAMEADILQIADDGSNDTYTDDEGHIIANTDHIQRSKLRVSARFELLKVMNPAKHGDKIDVNHGGQAGNPIRMIAAGMSQQEASNLYLEMLNQI